MIILNLLLIIIIFLLVRRRTRQYLSLMNHLVVFSVIWVFIIIGAQLAYPDVILDSSVLLYYCCLLFYIFGSSIIPYKNQLTSLPEKGYHYCRIKWMLFILFILTIIANVDIITEVFFNFRSIENLVMMRKKQEFSEIDESNIFKALFQRAYLIVIPLGFLLYKKKKFKLSLLIVLIFFATLLSLSKFTRAPFMQLLLVMLITYVYLYRVKLPLKLVGFVALLILVVFGVTTFFIFDSSNPSSDFSEQTNLYLFGGLVAYQDILNGQYIDNQSYTVSLYSFDFLNYILAKVEIIDSYPSYVREWTANRYFNTNTYTFLDCFTLDFGIVGALLGSFVIGLLSDVSYAVMRKSNFNIFTIIFYGYVCYFNIFVFANNEFIRFTVLLTIVLLLVFNFLSQKIKYHD